MAMIDSLSGDLEKEIQELEFERRMLRKMISVQLTPSLSLTRRPQRLTQRQTSSSGRMRPSPGRPRTQESPGGGLRRF